MWRRLFVVPLCVPCSQLSVLILELKWHQKSILDEEGILFPFERSSIIFGISQYSIQKLLSPLEICWSKSELLVLSNLLEFNVDKSVGYSFVSIILRLQSHDHFRDCDFKSFSLILHSLSSQEILSSTWSFTGFVWISDCFEQVSSLLYFRTCDIAVWIMTT